MLVLGEAISDGAVISRDAIMTGVLTFFTALAAIWFLMAIVKRYFADQLRGLSTNPGRRLAVPGA